MTDSDQNTCLLCMEDGCELVYPCRDRDHSCCQKCWEDWEKAHDTDFLPCPTCREYCFTESLRQCRSFRIDLNDPFVYRCKEQYDDESIIRDYENIYQALEGFREHIQYVDNSRFHRLKIVFYSPETGIEHVMNQNLYGFICYGPPEPRHEVYQDPYADEDYEGYEEQSDDEEYRQYCEDMYQQEREEEERYGRYSDSDRDDHS